MNIRRLGWTSAFLIGVTGILAVFPLDVRADITPSLDLTGTAAGTFTYEVSVAADQVFGVGSYLTIYDVGLVSDVVAPGGLLASQSLVGATPDGTSPADDPTTLNLTFTSSGLLVLGEGAFSVSFFHGATDTQVGVFAAEGRNAAGAPVSNEGIVDVPLRGVPEPATLALLGSGLVALSVTLRRRQR